MHINGQNVSPKFEFFHIFLTGEKGDPFPGFDLNRFRGDGGLPGLPGLQGQPGLPGLPGMYALM